MSEDEDSSMIDLTTGYLPVEQADLLDFDASSARLHCNRWMLDSQLWGISSHFDIMDE